MAKAKRTEEPEVEKPDEAREEVGAAAELPMVEAWVPGHRSPEFEARLAEQAAAIANSPDEREVMEWIEQLYDSSDWDWDE